MSERLFQLTLVRHGETEANKMDICQGQMDVHLSEYGKKQAMLLAKSLATESFSKLYTSDLVRCVETASFIARHHENLSVVADPRLRERCHGSLEGQPFSVVRKAMRQAGMSPGDFAAPGGERLDQVRRRVLDFFDSMCRDYCKLCSDTKLDGPTEKRETTILCRYQRAQPGRPMPEGEVRGHMVVVSHGGPIDCLLKHFKGRYGCQLSSGGITPNTGVSSFIVCIKCHPHPTCVSVSALVTHDVTHMTPDGEVSLSAPVTQDTTHLTPSDD